MLLSSVHLLADLVLAATCHIDGSWCGRTLQVLSLQRWHRGGTQHLPACSCRLSGDAGECD